MKTTLPKRDREMEDANVTGNARDIHVSEVTERAGLGIRKCW
jgi:hypothetical protein